MVANVVLGLLIASGVFVESVDPGSPADKAGLVPGDRIIAWSQGSESGPILTPFDLEDAELERAPRGSVTVEGFRTEGSFSLPFSEEAWGVHGRPDLQETTLGTLQAARLAESEKRPTDAAQTLADAAAKAVDPGIRAWLHLQSARSWEAGARFEEAQAQYESALDGLGPRDAAAVWSLRAKAYQAATVASKAQTAYETAASLLETAQADSLRFAEARRALARFLLVTADPRAGSVLHLGTSIAERLAPDSLLVAKFWTAEGRWGQQVGDLETAVSLTERAYSLQNRKTPGSPAMVPTLINLGVYSLVRGDLAKAESSLRRAVAICGGAPGADAFYHSAALFNLGVVLAQRGDLDAAEDALKRALDVGRNQPPLASAAPMILSNLGEIAAERGDLAQAEQLLVRSLRIVEDSGVSVELGAPLVGLGELALARGDFEQAEAYFDRARTTNLTGGTYGTLMDRILIGLAQVAESRGDLLRAETLYREAVQAQSVQRPGSFEEAAALGALASVVSRAGRTTEAASLYAGAVSALEHQRGRLGHEQERGSLRMAGFSRLHAEYAAVLLALGRPEEAFDVLEASRARALLELIVQRDLEFGRDIPPALDRERRRIQASYDRVLTALGNTDPQANREGADDLAAQLRDLQQARLRVAADVRGASSRLAEIQDPRPVSLDEARRVLDEGTVLLSYLIGEDKTILFVVEPARGTHATVSGFRIVEIPAGRTALQERVAAFLALLRNPAASTRDLVGTASAMYQLLVAPAADMLAAHKRILVSPDGPLQSMPFAALVRSIDADRPSFLAEWRPVHVIASATLYAEMRQRPATPRSTAPKIAAFGDPVYAGGKEVADEVALRSGVHGRSLSALPETRREVREIARLFPRGVATYLAADATEENAKALPPGTRYLHFACHSLMNDRSPLDSALVLTLPEAPMEGRENGLLQAWEIFEDLRIDAEIVTLSACESGLGTDVAGEGLVGLTRAFQYAGARSVLASLWSVADGSTADLMAVFYRKLKEGKPKDQALQQAQVAMIRRGYSPFHWAAFQLTGDWR